jgi:tight adherence protein C
VIEGRDLLVTLTSGAAVAAAARLVVAPTPRLGPRVRPYTIASRTALGRDADVTRPGGAGPLLSAGTLRRLGEPLVGPLAARLGRLLDRDGDAALLLRLRQAGALRDVPEDRRAQEHRIRQLTAGLVWSGGLGALPLLVAGSAPLAVLLAALGFVVGVARTRAAVDAAIDARRTRMRIELYTVNQLLALHVRVGGGVVQAVQRIVDRGDGAVVEELAEVLQLHRGGRRITDALAHAARVTPEPNAARTYLLLARGVEHGTDLAEGLRGLSEDIRRQRTEAIKRQATRRRAAMLLPIIAVLAPVMLLFIAAPLPSIVLGGTG